MGQGHLFMHKDSCVPHCQTQNELLFKSKFISLDKKYTEISWYHEVTESMTIESNEV